MSEKAEHLKDEGSPGQVVIAGGVAGLVSRFCIAPLDVVKIRLQLQTHSRSATSTNSSSSTSRPSSAQSARRTPAKPQYTTTLSTFRTIIRTEGPTALWKGNLPAEFLYLTYGSLQFTLYHTLSSHISTLPPPYRLPDAAESFVAGATAGGVATSATYPLDLLRTRFAAQGIERVYGSLAGSVRDIAAQEGSAGFWRGGAAAVSQIVPYMGLFFACYESLKVALPSVLPQATAVPIAGTGDALAGIVASVVAKTAVFPLDTVRKRLQVQGPTRSRYFNRGIPVYKGVLGTVGTILEREGVRGLYRGLGVGLGKAAPASAVTMWTYERVMRGLRAWEADSEGG
ncbi:MAG: mitochondrial thiamine pyrophosphate transporter [Chrysothrix sp. TS-e1954]|nr:MAG: mitochondrial thiamine pyrophosphate transporter [Chrysothrix sp. TS-e1954]